VGPEDLQERHRSFAWTYRICTSGKARLRTVGRFKQTEGRHPICQPRLLWQKLCTLDHGEAPNLLVSFPIAKTLFHILTLDRDAFTTSSDFIISPHTAAKGLYVATCGNFHGWKFFPVLGKYIISMLEGTLEPELCEKWGWDRDRPDPKHFADWPRHDMKDMLDPVRTARL
jgi:hypothetical protein